MAQNTNIYRTPPDPGFIGGYNWSSMLFGLLVLSAVNIAATQYVAYRFRYQAALGTPLARYGEVRIYQPVAWAQWLLRHGSTSEARVRLPLLSGAFIVVVGSALTVGIVYAMNIRRAK